MSEDSCTIVSAEDELLHDFVIIDVVDDVLAHGNGNAIETLLAARRTQVYVFRRRRLLKLRSAVADDTGLTSRSLTRLSTSGKIARIAGVMFLNFSRHWCTLPNFVTWGFAQFLARSGTCPIAYGMIDHQMSTPGTDERPFR